MRTGRTVTSAVLRDKDGKKLDELEPRYPLLVHRRLDDGRLQVTALKKPPRDKDQPGYIWHDLVEVDEPSYPPPRPLRPAMKVKAWVIGALLAATAVAFLLAFL